MLLEWLFNWRTETYLVPKWESTFLTRPNLGRRIVSTTRASARCTKANECLGWKAFSTSSDGKGVPVAVSDDAFTWTLTGDDALTDKGPWTDPKDQAVWAPDVVKNVRYRRSLLHNKF